MANILKFMAEADRRIWYFLSFIIVCVLLLNPVGFPLRISPETKVSFDLINSLKPGDIVLVNYDIAAYGWDELKGQCESVIPHLFEKEGVKILFMSNMDQGPLFIEQTFKDVAKYMEGYNKPPWFELNGKKYLEDYIILGFFPGQESVFAALAKDFRGNVKNTDWYGNEITAWLDDIGLKSASDIDLAISFDCTSGAHWLGRHFYVAYGTPIINGQIGVSLPDAIIQYNAGVYKGLIKSTRGAAEYQYLSGYKGFALISMDAFSAVHIFLVIIIVIGNIGYFGWERKAKKG